jgi:hypothetical protein
MEPQKIVKDGEGSVSSARRRFGGGSHKSSRNAGGRLSETAREGAIRRAITRGETVTRGRESPQHACTRSITRYADSYEEICALPPPKGADDLDDDDVAVLLAKYGSLGEPTRIVADSKPGIQKRIPTRTKDGGESSRTSKTF